MRAIDGLRGSGEKRGETLHFKHDLSRKGGHLCYSYVLSGRLSAQVGDDVVEAGPGELVVKPRGTPHAFWNAGSEPVRFLELISPGGFEEYFFELAAPFNARDAQAMDEIRERYRLGLRMETIPELLERNGLQPPF